MAKKEISKKWYKSPAKPLKRIIPCLIMGKFEKGNIPWNKNKGDELLTIKILKSSDGYRRFIKVRRGTSRNYMLYSRYIAGRYIQRKLKKSEIVHHKDEDKLNDDISNLKLVNRSEHLRIHRKGKIPIRAIMMASEKRKILRDIMRPKVLKCYSKIGSLRKVSIELGISRFLVTKLIKEEKNDYKTKTIL